MQRRAAALYAALMIILAAGAYGMIGAAQEPAISIQNPDYSLSQGDSFTVNGQTYDVAEVGEAGGELVWVNESARFTETIDAGAIELESSEPTGLEARLLAANDDLPLVTIAGGDYRVLVDLGDEEPDQFFLVEAFSLPDGTETQEVNNQTYVVDQEGDSPELVPLGDWLADRFGQPATSSYAEGDTIEYQNETTRIDSVTNDSVTLRWIGAQENTISVSEGSVITLNSQEFVPHFPDAQTLELSSDIEAYEQQLAVQDTYEERINGLWGVSLLGAFGAIVLISMAFLPSRY